MTAANNCTNAARLTTPSSRTVEVDEWRGFDTQSTRQKRRERPRPPDILALAKRAGKRDSVAADLACSGLQIVLQTHALAQLDLRFQIVDVLLGVIEDVGENVA